MKHQTIAYEVSGAAYNLEKSNPPTLVVTAKGKGNTGGWTAPTLVAMEYITPPADGIWTFELQGLPPTGTSADAILPIEGEARFERTGQPFPWFKGIRVKAQTNDKVVSYS